MSLKERLFRWALKRKLKTLPVDEGVVLTPDHIVIPLQFNGSVPIEWKFETPSWWKVLGLVLEVIL